MVIGACVGVGNMRGSFKLQAALRYARHMAATAPAEASVHAEEEEEGEEEEQEEAEDDSAEDPLQQAAAEGLTLTRSQRSQTGWKCVQPNNKRRFKVVASGRYLGCFDTAEQATLGSLR